MANKISVVGANPRKIQILDQPKRHIEMAELASALGAKPTGTQTTRHSDLISLAELGTQLLIRLRSSGGRPALVDATVNCRVPLSTEDIKTLETMVEQIGGSTGAKPSVGQLASVIVRMHLNALKGGPELTATVNNPNPAVENEISRNILRQIIEEQINPLRERMKRLENEISTHFHKSQL